MACAKRTAQLRAEGVDIGIISKQLGHRTIATTARYLDHIGPARQQGDPDRHPQASSASQGCGGCHDVIRYPQISGRF